MHSEVYSKVVVSISDYPLAPQTHYLFSTAKESFRVKKSDLFPLQKNYVYALEQLEKSEKKRTHKDTKEGQEAERKQFAATRIRVYKDFENKIKLKQDTIFEERPNGEFNLLLEIKRQGVYLLSFNENSKVDSAFGDFAKLLKKAGREVHLNLKGDSTKE